MRPARLAPYFVLAALIHLAAIASRFETIAAWLPGPAALAIMVAQFPLLVLSGYFEGQLDYGSALAGTPRWMQISSRPVKLAFTFGFIYLAVVVAQIWDLKLGPVDLTPPASFPLAQRATWFAMFTVGMFFPFYLLATKVLIPVLRALTWPLRLAPALIGAPLALAEGGGLGLVVLAAVTSKRIGDFIAGIQAAIEADPALAIGVVLAGVFVPMLLGVVLGGLRRGRGAEARR